jgi:membrane protein
VLAVPLWVLASAGFASYVGDFENYDNIYGSVAGVVVFLVWLWISNRSCSARSSTPNRPEAR